MLEVASQDMQNLADQGENSWAADKRLVVEFRTEVVHDPEESAREGRYIAHEVEFLRIISPGDRNNIVDRPVLERDRIRFQERYERWKKRNDGQDKLTGTPLRVVPWITRVQAEELAYHGVRTVEDLANLNDADLRKVMGGIQMRQKARDMLDVAAKGAAASQMRAELEKRDTEIEVLKRQMAEILAEKKTKKKEE